MFRSLIVVTSALLLTGCCCRCPCAGPGPVRPVMVEVAQAGPAQGKPKFLFVQTAKRVTTDGKTLTLEGASHSTLFFSDRPHRIAGHVTTEAFFHNWNEGKDSFAKDPPNAVLSVLGGDAVSDTVVVLTNPRYDESADRIQYDVKVLDGQLPASGGRSSLFIDDTAEGHYVGGNPVPEGHFQGGYVGGSGEVFHGHYSGHYMGGGTPR